MVNILEKKSDFKNSIKDVILKRISSRLFRAEEVSVEEVRELENYVSERGEGVFGNRSMFKIIRRSRLSKAEKLGTYGFIRGASLFVTGKAHSSDELAIVDYGYELEKIILKCTDMGLGTCWLGGSLNRSDFGRSLDLSGEEIVPAVSPIGYIYDKIKGRDRAFRWFARADKSKRKPWGEIFFDSSFDQDISKSRLLQSNEANYADVLEMVRIGPSASNKQPWRIVKSDGGFHFYLENDKKYQKVIKLFNIQALDMGIAMCHFELAARENDLTGQWIVNDPQLQDRPDNYTYYVSWMVR